MHTGGIKWHNPLLDALRGAEDFSWIQQYWRGVQYVQLFNENKQNTATALCFRVYMLWFTEEHVFGWDKQLLLERRATDCGEGDPTTATVYVRNVQNMYMYMYEECHNVFTNIDTQKQQVLWCIQRQKERTDWQFAMLADEYLL